MSYTNFYIVKKINKMMIYNVIFKNKNKDTVLINYEVKLYKEQALTVNLTELRNRKNKCFRDILL